MDEQRMKLLEYLPDFMKQFRDIREIMQAEDKEMDRLNAGIQKAIGNAFIEDCDEYGIRKYEALLGITSDPMDSMDQRRARVLSRWADNLPCTYWFLLKKLDALCGTGNYAIDRDLENYFIRVGVFRAASGSVKDVEEMLEKLLPMNICYEVHEERPISGAMYAGAVIQQAEIVSIRQVI